MNRRIGRVVAVSAIAAVAPLCAGVASTVSAQSASALPVAASGSATGSSPSKVMLETDYQAQQTGYWCGPAAVRHALSARGQAPSQKSLAGLMGTTTNGTNSVTDIRRGLNRHTNGYDDVFTPAATMSSATKELMWKRVKSSINKGRPVVVNIVAYPGSDAAPSHYPNSKIYHYVTISGYDAEGTNRVRVVDSAFGVPRYWLSFSKMARLTAEKGYVYYKG